jgi:hypothetical protein
LNLGGQEYYDSSFKAGVDDVSPNVQVEDPYNEVAPVDIDDDFSPNQQNDAADPLNKPLVESEYLQGEK